MTALMYILIFLLVGGLMVVQTARLHSPLNFVVDGVVFLIVMAVSLKLFGIGGLTISLFLWMLVIVFGLYGLRFYLRKH